MGVLQDTIQTSMAAIHGVLPLLQSYWTPTLLAPRLFLFSPLLDPVESISTSLAALQSSLLAFLYRHESFFAVTLTGTLFLTWLYLVLFVLGPVVLTLLDKLFVVWPEKIAKFVQHAAWPTSHDLWRRWVAAENAFLAELARRCKAEGDLIASLQLVDSLQTSQADLAEQVKALTAALEKSQEQNGQLQAEKANWHDERTALVKDYEAKVHEARTTNKALRLLPTNSCLDERACRRGRMVLRTWNQKLERERIEIIHESRKREFDTQVKLGLVINSQRKAFGEAMADQDEMREVIRKYKEWLAVCHEKFRRSDALVVELEEEKNQLTSERNKALNERDEARDDYDQAMADYEEAEEKCAEQFQELKVLKKKVADLEKNTTTSSENTVSSNETNEGTKKEALEHLTPVQGGLQEIAEVLKNNEDLNKKNTDDDEEAQQLRGRIADLEKEIDDLQKVKTEGYASEECKNKCVFLEKQTEQLKEERENSKTTSDSTTDLLIRKNKEIETVKEAAEKLQTEKDDLNAALNEKVELEQQRDQAVQDAVATAVTDEKARLEKKYTKQIEAQKKTIQEKDEDLGSAQWEHADLRKEINDLKAQVQEVEKLRETAETDSQTDNENAELKAEIVLLKSQVQEIEKLRETAETDSQTINENFETIGKLGDAKEALEEEKKALQEAKTAAELQKDAAAQELANAKAEIQRLTTTLQTPEGVSEELKQVVQANHEREVDSVKQAWCSHHQTEMKAQLEQAKQFYDKHWKAELEKQEEAVRTEAERCYQKKEQEWQEGKNRGNAALRQQEMDIAHLRRENAELRGNSTCKQLEADIKALAREKAELQARFDTAQSTLNTIGNSYTTEPEQLAQLMSNLTHKDSDIVKAKVETADKDVEIRNLQRRIQDLENRPSSTPFSSSAPPSPSGSLSSSSRQTGSTPRAELSSIIKLQNLERENNDLRQKLNSNSNVADLEKKFDTDIRLANIRLEDMKKERATARTALHEEEKLRKETQNQLEKAEAEVQFHEKQILAQRGEIHQEQNQRKETQRALAKAEADLKFHEQQISEKVYVHKTVMDEAVMELQEAAEEKERELKKKLTEEEQQVRRLKDALGFHQLKRQMASQGQVESTKISRRRDDDDDEDVVDVRDVRVNKNARVEEEVQDDGLDDCFEGPPPDFD